MDILTVSGVNHYIAEMIANLQTSFAARQWLIATVCAAIGSTIVYNLVKFRILGRKAPPKWTWDSFPLWCILWLNKALLFMGILMVIWYLSRMLRNREK
jgi:hypothetical protein